MGRTSDEGASVGKQHVTHLPRGRRSPAAAESSTGTYKIEVIAPDRGRARVGDATIEAPMGQLNHFICLLRQTERPTPPPGVMASNDCTLDHEAA